MSRTAAAEREDASLLQNRAQKEHVPRPNQSTVRRVLPRGRRMDQAPTHRGLRRHTSWKAVWLEAAGDEAKWVQTWKTKNPYCKHKLWNDTEIAALAKEKSPELLWPIWEGLSNVERADVFRYLVLWDQGGYYADTDAACVRPIATWEVPRNASMIVGYEFGHRWTENEREKFKFARTEQMEQWFFASAPQNPILLRCLELVRQRFAWGIQSTMFLTGPGVFSDAVHEFLEMNVPEALDEEVSYRSNATGVLDLSKGRQDS
ncbi:6-mannosyltransferase [Durusdinium trenchii]|uniref:6-mannosyltransferase n=1 Tax=Durusdinium trenchii TaxID=1381693 RepID=A0ABP0HUN5_9DINO